ncbi:MAG: LuxR C-terminal-related transcriptional regulator, partial [Pseudomonadota bacterium]|nr:LuxR C-terminal-related transcriptional regulator [Pseudomonadota bacterium]
QSALILLDMNMPGASGFDVLAAIRDRKDLLSIVITGQGDTRMAVQAMKAGAIDFLEKPCEPKALLQTIDQAFENLEETEQVIARTGEAREKVSRLSARERDVLEGLIEGKSNKVIGYELDISPRTVEVYRGKMMDKLEVQSLPEALRVAFAAGLVEA